MKNFTANFLFKWFGFVTICSLRSQRHVREKLAGTTCTRQFFKCQAVFSGPFDNFQQEIPK